MTLFLDIDGVLNIEDGNKSTFMRTRRFLENDLVENLNSLLRQVNMNIVISSSWRCDMADLLKILQEHNFKYINNITARTNLNNKTRSQQIIDYCRTYNIDKFIVLDDSKREFNDGKLDECSIYYTDRTQGLTINDVSKLIEIINTHLT